MNENNEEGGENSSDNDDCESEEENGDSKEEEEEPTENVYPYDPNNDAYSVPEGDVFGDNYEEEPENNEEPQEEEEPPLYHLEPSISGGVYVLLPVEVEPESPPEDENEEPEGPEAEIPDAYYDPESGVFFYPNGEQPEQIPEIELEFTPIPDSDNDPQNEESSPESNPNEEQTNPEIENQPEPIQQPENNPNMGTTYPNSYSYPLEELEEEPPNEDDDVPVCPITDFSDDGPIIKDFNFGESDSDDSLHEIEDDEYGNAEENQELNEILDEVPFLMNELEQEDDFDKSDEEEELENENEVKMLFEYKVDDKIHRVYSNGNIEIVEAIPKIRKSLPLNIKLWLDMNRKSKERLKTKIHFEYEDENGSKELILNVEVEIYKYKNGTIIVLPFNKTGDRIRELMQKKGKLKTQIIGLINDELYSNDFENGIEILVELLRPELEEYQVISFSLKNFKVYLFKIGNRIYVKKEPLAKELVKEEDILLFESEKTVRGTSLQIYADGKIVFRGSGNRIGIKITNDTKKWKIIPKIEDDYELIVYANYEWTDCEGNTIRVENIKSKIYSDKYYTLIKPIEENSVITTRMIDNQLVTCEILGFIDGIEQIPSTQYLKQARNLILKSNLKNIEKAIKILKGGKFATQYEIFMDKDGKIYIKHSGIMNRWGWFRLSSEFFNIFENWNQDDLFCCSVNGTKPLIIQGRVLVRSTGKLSKSLVFPKYAPKENVEIIFTNPNLKLNTKILSDLKLRNRLKEAGIKVNQLVSNTKNVETHADPILEQELYNLLSEVVKLIDKSSILFEVDLTSENELLYCDEGDGMCCDVVIFSKSKIFKKMPLIIIEFKAPLNHSPVQLRSAIASMKHMQRRLGYEKVIPIVVYSQDIYSKNKIITREYGESLGIILLGPSDISKYKLNPVRLLNRIINFMNKTNPITKLQQSEKSKIKLNKSSIKRLKETNRMKELAILKKYEKLINCTLPDDVEITNLKSQSGKGGIFEEEMRKELEDKGYDVISNAIVSNGLYLAEIDLIAFKGDEIIIISCKDRSDYKDHPMLISHLRNDLNQLEMNMGFTNIKNGIYFGKVKPEYREEIKKRFHNKKWSEGLDIDIR